MSASSTPNSVSEGLPRPNIGFRLDARLVIIRGTVWAILGCLYGLLFVLVAAWMPTETYPHAGLVGVSVATTAFVSLMYGSMRLVVIAAIYSSIAIVITFLARIEFIQIEPLIVAGTLTGAAVGSVYGWRVKNSRVFRADGKIIAGATAGLLASLSILIPDILNVPLPRCLQAALIAPLSGLLYLSLAPYCVRYFSDVLSPPADGALVGAGVGLLMALLFWMMSGTLDGYLEHSDQIVVNQLTAQLPSTILAATIATAAVGILRGLLNVRWSDL